MSSRSGVRLAELVASLSLATDLGLGQPQEHVLRQTVIADRLATVVGVDADARAALYYVSLLAWVGCVADSHELARWFGDDSRLRGASYQVDRAGLPMLRFLLANLELAGGTTQRLASFTTFMTAGLKEVMSSMDAHCQTTGEIADGLGLAPEVSRALPQVMERWDGRGAPRHLQGHAIEPIMRIAQIANEAEVFARMGGSTAVVDMLRSRRGGQFDPALVDVAIEHAADLLDGLDSVDAWTTVIEGSAPLDRVMGEGELDMCLETFADYADLKSPWFLGHSRATAALTAEAARRGRLPPDDVRLVRRAALVSRLGVIGVSAATWNRPGHLSAIELERVHRVPYLTERVLKNQPVLAEIGSVAGMFHERLDGSGYPRGLSASAIPPGARLLAAAEVYQALREDRPHRPAFSRDDAAKLLAREVTAGRLDGAAVHAVLAAAGHQTRRQPTLTGGLSPREAEVLALVARGFSNKQIAARLSITPKTAGSHIEHIYDKIGATTRGSAALYAMRHGLVDATAPTEELLTDIG
jgi:HD-GYP domain-containing protein (c-di-GMP phosphodiesterase class II)